MATAKRGKQRAASPQLDSDTLLEMYRQMVLSRTLDERIWMLNRQGKAAIVASSQGHEAGQIGSAYALERGKDQFDTLYAEGAESARIMSVSTHPYITGAAHRIRYYDRLFEYMKSHEGVVFMTGSEILDWYREAAR